MASFTLERREHFLGLLKRGHTITDACAIVRVATSTVSRWAARGRAAGAPREHADFAARLDAIQEGRKRRTERGLTQAQLIRRLERAARRDDVEAIGLLLERPWEQGAERESPGELAARRKAQLVMHSRGNADRQSDEYVATVQLLRDATLNQNAAGEVMFDGQLPATTDREVLNAAVAVEPEEFRALCATIRQSEDAVLCALRKLAMAEGDGCAYPHCDVTLTGPRIAQMALLESKTDWLWILRRAIETIEGDNA